MTVKDSNTAGGDVSLIIAYNMGADFESRSGDTKKAQVLSMLKTRRVHLASNWRPF